MQTSPVALGGIFYRKRRRPLHHKSGNIADFCRRWGADYRYLIVLDADSVMTGAAFVRLASLMEANPRTGIIQTNTKLALGRSLFQRINQFAGHAYGPLFAAGANFWQLDNANYYGHNAIVRLKPFMKFCAMPELPKSGALGIARSQPRHGGGGFHAAGGLRSLVGLRSGWQL